MEKISTDILIIGAGPGGCTAAMTAHQNGLSAIIIDREKFPRDKTCGDGVSFGSLNSLKEVGMDDKLFLKNKQYIKSAKLHFFGFDNEKTVLENDIFFTIKRKLFDNILWENIPNKIIKHDQAAISEIEHTGEKYLVRYETPNGKVEVEAKYIIGADGYSSYVRRNLFKGLSFDKRVASRYYLTDENYSNDSYDFYFHEKVAPGYFWIFKVSENTYNTGVYLPNDKPAKAIFELHNYFIQKHFNQSIDRENFATWTIPNNTDFNSLAKNNAVLIGDAAGFCDKLIGHGIDAAILSGIVAIRSIYYHLNRNTKEYPIEEIYRYNLSQYFKDSLIHSAKVYEQIQNDKPKASQFLKSYFNDVLH